MKNKKKIIVILGGALARDKNGGWRTTNFEVGDNFGVCGGRLRVIAANLLFKRQLGQLIIASGSQGQLKGILPGGVTLASVIKGELIKIGVPARSITKEEKSNNTYQQLKEIQKMIKTYDFRKIIIISNKYHLPRVKAMIEYVRELSLMKRWLDLSSLEIKSAEAIVMRYEPKIWRKFITKAYKSRAVKKRIEFELRGAEQIKKGLYRLE